MWLNMLSGGQIVGIVLQKRDLRQGPDQYFHFSLSALIWGHHITGTQLSHPNFEMVLFLNSLVQTFLFELRTGIFFIINMAQLLWKRVPVLCLWFWGVFVKIPFYIFTSQEISRIFRGSLCRHLKVNRWNKT